MFGAVFLCLIIIIQTAGISADERPILHLFVLLFLILAILFSTLTVEVNRQNLIWYFGPGIWKYHIPIDDIEEVIHVRNHPLEGFGIRWTPTKGWLYNVSGLDAVKIIRKSGKTTRIGSNEPNKLIKVIQEEIRFQ